MVIGLRTLDVRRIGTIPYEDGLALQATLVEERKADKIPDTLLLLQHPPVITLGVKTRQGPKHIVATDEELAAAGVTVHETGRGGDVTYHGPGQLVGYPILNLAPDRKDVHIYVRDIEEVLIRAAAAFGIDATRVPGLTGVWVGPEGPEGQGGKDGKDGKDGQGGQDGREEKLAAIGIRISRWVTSHGFALNVSTHLEHFNLIVPCGIVDRGVTSLEKLLGRTVAMEEAEAAVEQAFFSMGWQAAT